MPLEPGWQDRLEDARRVRASAKSQNPECFKELQKFCVFVGQSRSGHSVVGTLLNAHRNAVISHNLDALDYLRAGVNREDLFLLILARDIWMANRDRKIGGYSYDLPGLWLGDHRAIRVIGDKRAGATSRHLAKNPELLRNLCTEVKLPVYVIHHVRNPWDNISSIWTAKTLGKNRSLPEAAEHYFEMLEGATAGLRAVEGEVSLIRTYHEDLILKPKHIVKELLEALDLFVDERFLSACETFVHRKPRETRHDAPWTPRLRQEVAERVLAYDFLNRYTL